MNDYILKFLGKDSGFGDENNCAYIEKNNKLLLIDCGFTVFKKIKERFDLSKYDEIKVIITHLHNDHAGSLSQLILYSYFNYNKKITVLSKCEYIEQYLNITGVPREAYEIKEDINFIKTEHVKYLDSYGFSLNINNVNIVYTGDTNTLDPFLPYIKNANELYVDVSRYGGAHLKIDDIIDTLKKIKKENETKIILMHLDDKEYIKNVSNGEFYI